MRSPPGLPAQRAEAPIGRKLYDKTRPVPVGPPVPWPGAVDDAASPSAPEGVTTMGKDVATVEKRSVMPKLVLLGLAAIGVYIVIGWALSFVSWLLSSTFLIIVLAIAVAVLWIKLRGARKE